jgi:hypothetical protein
MASVVNINDVLDGHASLELECVDRLDLNAYVWCSFALVAGPARLPSVSGTDGA